MRSLPHSCPKISKEQTWNFLSHELQTRASYTKPAFQVSKRGVHYARVWRTWDLEVNKLVFHQLTQGSCLQSMDAWISSQLSKLQEKHFLEVLGRDQETKSFHNRRWQSFEETEPYHGKSHFLPEEKFSESWMSSVKARLWKHLKRCFFDFEIT